MNHSKTSVCLLLLLFIPNFSFADDTPKATSLAEIKQICLAVALADFPIQQGKLHEQILGDLSKNIWSSWGTSRSVTEPKYKEDMTYWYWALTDPASPSGYYSIRLTYGKSAGKPEEIPIEAIEVLFDSPNHLRFAYEGSTVDKIIIPTLKTEMKKRGLTPRALAEEKRANAEEADKSWKEEEVRLESLKKDSK